MRIEEELKLDYSDVLFRPKRSTLKSRKDVNLLRTYRFKHSKNEWSGTPIMAANMDGVGELDVAEKINEYGMITCLTKQHDVKKIKQNKKIKSMYHNIAISIGIKKEDFQNLDKIMKEFSFIKFICIDVANGYSEHFTSFIKSVRDKYPTKTIIAGNVVTADMTQELVLSGADIVKVGIGPGSVCTTRIQTGVGYPQLSAVIECADAAHGLGAHIIADGGCTCPGDVAKGFGGGADFVMLGGFAVWFLWIEAAPIALFLINLFTSGLAETNIFKLHLIESVPYFRFLMMGVGLLLIMRYRPKGILPEKIIK